MYDFVFKLEIQIWLGNVLKVLQWVSNYILNNVLYSNTMKFPPKYFHTCDLRKSLLKYHLFVWVTPTPTPQRNYKELGALHM